MVCMWQMLSQDLRVEAERTQNQTPQTVASMYYQSQGSYQFDTAETTYCTACPISADPRRWYRYNAFDSCAAHWHHSTVVFVQLVSARSSAFTPSPDSRLRSRLTRWCSKLRLRLRLDALVTRYAKRRVSCWRAYSKLLETSRSKRRM